MIHSKKLLLTSKNLNPINFLFKSSQRNFKSDFKLLEDYPKDQVENLGMFITSKKHGFLPR
jgi:hypothetical protein